MNEEQINEAMRLGELWATYAWKACSHGADETVKSQAGRAALEAYLRTISAEPTFQQRIQPWMLACFGAEIAADKAERNHRFLEEALELVQATGCSAGEAHQLVDYVYGRPVGEPVQEIGGVMVTLAALCLAHGMDMHGAAETELARIWTKVEQIRAKQAAKPKHSPLPEMVVMAQNTFPINPNGASKWAHLQKHDGAQAIGVVFRTGTGSVGSLVDGRVVWADWLAHPNGSKPESVNAEMLEPAMKTIDELGWDDAGEATTLAAAAADADEWLALIERLHNNGRGPWKFSDPESAGNLSGCRASLHRFIEAERAKDQLTKGRD